MSLKGIRVIDLTRIIAGPFCTQLLADLGADVIKVESLNGDPLREQGQKVAGFSWYFASYNRNKRSVVLDLHREEGLAVLRDMVAGADVLVENYRAGILDKMGLSDTILKRLNPNLIVCHISGFGADGPYSDRPSFDFIAQAMTGYMSVNGQPRRPTDADWHSNFRPALRTLRSIGGCRFACRTPRHSTVQQHRPGSHRQSDQLAELHGSRHAGHG